MKPLGLVALVLCASLAPLKLARACDEPEGCDYTNKWRSVHAHSSTVAADGVVVLRGKRGQLAPALDDDEALAALDAQVEVDGQPVAGALELAGDWDAIIWRPDAPLGPGTLSITLSVDNTVISDSQVPFEALGCDVEDAYQVGPLELEVIADALPGLELVGASVELDDTPIFSYEPTVEALERLVCCDDGYPRFEDTCGAEIFWAPGHCAWARARARVGVMWALNIDALPPALAGNLAWRLEGDGGTEHVGLGLAERGALIDAPTCRRAVVSNLATGEELDLGGPCVGEELADELGIQELDPSEELAAMCEGEPYVCEPDGGAWNPDACTPWPEGEDGGDEDGGTGEPIDGDSGGCSVDTRGGGRAGMLAMGLLLLLGRRRESTRVAR